MNLIKELRQRTSCALTILEEYNNIAAKEIRLVNHSSCDFIFALKPLAMKLSVESVMPYEYYLDKAQYMLLEGKSMADVLCEFESMLREHKEYDTLC